MEGEGTVAPRAKKIRRNPDTWKRNIRKKDNRMGKKHTTKRGKLVPERKQTDVDCRCKCLSKIDEDCKQSILEKFNNLESHSLQNAYLRSNIRKVEVERPKKEAKRKRVTERSRYEYSFFDGVNDLTINICKNSFLALHGIKESRLKKKVLAMSLDQSFGDGRGKHENHRKISEEIKELIRNHIKSFPARESHYSRRKNKRKVYLSSDLNVSKMVRLFREKYPDVEIKDWLYHDIFNYEFNISFGSPRTDICDTCESFQKKIKEAEATGNEEEIKKVKSQHELHVRKGDTFYQQLGEQQVAAMNDDTVEVFVMDFEKNLPLPLTNIGKEYYLRQLWIHNFNIHHMDGPSIMHLYAEHYAKKGPNEVISMLNHEILKLPQNVTHLRIFCDNCFSQNKNRFLIAYFYYIVHSSNLEEIEIFYPIPGHSFMPCDRDFAKIEIARKKKDRVIRPSKWVNMVETARKKNPFVVKYLQFPLTDNMSDDGHEIVNIYDLRSVADKYIKAKFNFKFSEARGFKFQKNADPQYRLVMSVNNTSFHKFNPIKRSMWKSSFLAAMRKFQEVPKNILPIKAAKLQNVKQLLSSVHVDDDITFYENLFATADVENNDEESDDDRE